MYLFIDIYRKDVAFEVAGDFSQLKLMTSDSEITL